MDIRIDTDFPYPFYSMINYIQADVQFTFQIVLQPSSYSVNRILSLDLHQ